MAETAFQVPSQFTTPQAFSQPGADSLQVPGQFAAQVPGLQATQAPGATTLQIPSGITFPGLQATQTSSPPTGDTGITFPGQQAVTGAGSAPVTLPSQVPTSAPTPAPSSAPAAVVAPGLSKKAQRLAMIERSMAARRTRIRSAIEAQCREQGLIKQDGTCDIEKYIKLNTESNIYTNFPEDVLARDIANDGTVAGKVPWYWKLHPAAITGQFRDGGKTKTKDKDGKVTEVSKYEIYWGYMESNGSKLSNGHFCITLPVVTCKGIKFERKSFEKEVDGKIVNSPYNLWEMHIELLPSDVEHMHVREVLQDLELGMANVWKHHAGKMNSGVAFNVSNPTASGMRGLTWYFATAGTDQKQRNASPCNIIVKLLEKDNDISGSTRTLFWSPVQMPGTVVSSDGKFIFPWNFLRDKVIKMVPTIRVLRTSNLGKNGSVAFELVSGCVVDFDKQAGIEEVKTIMDELIADDDSIVSNLAEKFKLFEEEFKSSLTEPEDTPSSDPETVNQNANITSDISKLGADIANLTGVGGGGGNNVPQNVPQVHQGAPQQFANPNPQQYPQGGPGPYPPPSSLPNPHGPGTQNIPLPNQGYTQNPGQYGMAFAPPQQHIQPGQPPHPSMTNYYGGQPGQTQFAPTYPSQ